MNKYSSNQIGYLQDSKQALQALNHALEFWDKDTFLFTLQNVVLAQGVAKIAKKALLSRENLYKVLQPNGNPRLSLLLQILEAIGFELKIAEKKHERKKVTRVGSLLQSYPVLASQWHPSLNLDLRPDDINLTSKRKIWWLCINNSLHSWQEAVPRLIKRLKNDYLNKDDFNPHAFEERQKKGCPHCINPFFKGDKYE